MHAARKFSPEKGRFSAFSYQIIRKRLYLECEFQQTIVCLNNYIRDDLSKIRKFSNAYYVKYGKPLSRQEASIALEIPLKRVVNAELVLARFKSTNYTDSMSAIRKVRSHHISALDTLIQEEQSALIGQALNSLPTNQRYIVLARIEDRKQTYCSIADTLGISVPTARREYKRALDALRDSLKHYFR